MDTPTHDQPARQLTFATDDQLARELSIAARDLAQCANGLDHLLTLVPSLARAIRTNLALIHAVIDQLDPKREAA